MLPNDFSLTHGFAVIFLFACWLLYSRVLAYFGRGSLNAQLAVVRRYWISGATRRAPKPFDGILLGHIINSTAFFGSATLIVLAAVLTALARVQQIHETISQLHFVAETSLELFALAMSFLAFVLAMCFFSFTYALRKLVYVLALLGALPDKSENCPTHDDLVDATTMVLSEAIMTFNFGIRGYYYAVAALCLLVSPVLSIAVTAFVTGILFHRQLMTPTARAIQKYVEAAKSLDR